MGLNNLEGVLGADSTRKGSEVASQVHPPISKQTYIQTNNALNIPTIQQVAISM